MKLRRHYKYIALILAVILGLWLFRSMGWQMVYWNARETNFSSSDLSRVRWIKDRGIEYLKQKQVIAIGVFNYEVVNRPKFMATRPHMEYPVITNPRVIYEYVHALVNSEPIELEPKDFIWFDEMRFVFADNTGLVIPYTMHTMEKIIWGKDWESKKLFELFERDYGPWQ